jgi:hypothetical protein
LSEWSFFSPVAITCAGHRGPRRRMCVSYLFLFLFFKKKLISWGCAIVSVCFPHFGGSVSTPAPVVMGLGTRVLRRCARAGLHTALPVPRHSFRDHRTRVVGTAPSCIWELARTATAKVRGQERNAVQATTQQHPVPVQDSSRSAAKQACGAHCSHMGCLLVRGTLLVLLSLRCCCTNISHVLVQQQQRQAFLPSDPGYKKGFGHASCWVSVGNPSAFAGRSETKLRRGRPCVYYRVGVVAGTFSHQRREPLLSRRGGNSFTLAGTSTVLPPYWNRGAGTSSHRRREPLVSRRGGSSFTLAGRS